MSPNLVCEKYQQLDLHPLLQAIHRPDRSVDTTEERAIVAATGLRLLSGIQRPSEKVDVLRSAAERAGHGVAGVQAP